MERARAGCSGGKSARLQRVLLGYLLEPCAEVAREHGGEDRGGDGNLERDGVVEAPHLIEPHSALPVAEEQLDLPAVISIKMPPGPP